MLLIFVMQEKQVLQQTNKFPHRYVPFPADMLTLQLTFEIINRYAIISIVLNRFNVFYI